MDLDSSVSRDMDDEDYSKTHWGRLQHFILNSLENRRMRVVLIQVFKLMKELTKVIQVIS